MFQNKRREGYVRYLEAIHWLFRVVEESINFDYRPGRGVKEAQKKKKSLKRKSDPISNLLQVHVNWSPHSLRKTHVPARHVTLSVTMPRPGLTPTIKRRSPRQTPPVACPYLVLPQNAHRRSSCQLINGSKFSPTRPF